MGDLVLAISAAFSSGLKLWLSEPKTTKKKSKDYFHEKALYILFGLWVIMFSQHLQEIDTSVITDASQNPSTEAHLKHHPLSPPGGTVSLNIS